MSVDLSTKARVVIADDSPEMLNAIERRLSAICSVVARAEDGFELLDQVREHQPDLLVTDVSMPRLNGLEALRQLRAQGLNTPAIIVTVHEDEELVKAGLEHGALGVVLKSQIEADLLPAVQAALAGRVFISERLQRKTNSD